MAFRQNYLNNLQTQSTTATTTYSQEAIHETLNKQSQKLYNGAVGIDFHNLEKPGNLANSAVLRMLEEEELGRNGHKKGLKRVAWPPPPTDNLEFDSYYQQNFEPLNKVGSPPAFSPPPNRTFSPPYQPQSPPPVISQSPAQGLPPQQSVRSQATPPPPQAARAQAIPPQAFSPVSFEPPKSKVVLLPQAPIRQAPSPVVPSQPVTSTIQGGNRMRGDQKWPPENVKQQAAAENEARVALAKGPAFRPRKVKKDYSSFFAQNALNPTYPGYRPPPGTQHYIEEGTSNL